MSTRLVYHRFRDEWVIANEVPPEALNTGRFDMAMQPGLWIRCSLTNQGTAVQFFTTDHQHERT